MHSSNSKSSLTLHFLILIPAIKVPGIGRVTADILRQCNSELQSANGVVTIRGITSTFGLIGVYMSFKNGLDESGTAAREVGPIEHAQKFFDWLGHIGVNGRSKTMIVDAIGQKSNIAFPGIYDPSAYDA